MRKTLQLFSVFVLALFATILPNSSIHAQELSELRVHISSFTFSAEHDIKLEAWHVSDEESIDSKQLANDLYHKTSSELTQLYQDSILSQSFSTEGQAVFYRLPAGWYYVRQNSGLNTLSIVPFLVYVSGATTQVEAKTTPVIPQQKEGYRTFQKISTSTAPLEQARFVVLQSIRGELSEVIIDGMNDGLVSGQDGKLTVGPLLYGEYYLKEIQAPEGYLLDSQLIPFEISEDSYVSDVIKIKNKPITPPGIDIPYTGNASLIVACSIGILLFLLGYRLVTLPDTRQ